MKKKDITWGKVKSKLSDADLKAFLNDSIEPSLDHIMFSCYGDTYFLAAKYNIYSMGLLFETCFGPKNRGY